LKSRPTRNETMMSIAHEISERSTCARRAVGCVLTDSHGRVLSIGHNGVPRGMPHCTDKPCIGATEPPGYHLDSCLAMHAEMNALLFCGDIMKIHTCYTTSSPCIQCIKALLQSSCELIVFDRVYDWKTMNMWTEEGRKVTQIKREEHES
jgi:dCMP deaminase